MGYHIHITAQAKKDIDALEPVLKKRLGKKLQQVADLDTIHAHAKRLVESQIGDYRLSIGNYRVLFDLHEQTLVILRVQHRKDVYR